MGKKSSLNKPIKKTRGAKKDAPQVAFFARLFAQYSTKNSARKSAVDQATSLTPFYFLLLFLETIGAFSYLIPLLLAKFLISVVGKFFDGSRLQFQEFIENSILLFAI